MKGDKMHIKTQEYLNLVPKGPAAVGDFADTLTDEEARIVYLEVSNADPSKLVRGLWFNYSANRFRVWALNHNKT